MSIAEALLKLNIVGEREICQMKAQARGMAFADLGRVQIDASAIASVPIALIRGHHALPVKRDGNTPWVAFDEVDNNSVERIKEATGLRVIPVMCLPAALDEAIAKLA